MEIRFVNSNDDKLELAKMLYYVDPYIYPYWFKNKIENSYITLVDMIKDESTIFYYKNILVAVEDNQILGCIFFVPPNLKPGKNYAKWDVDFESHHIISYYINDIINGLIPNDIYVIGVFVKPQYRRKCIATKMFTYLLENISAQTCSLEVLADNVPAINLYKNLNFQTIKRYKGYNGYKRKKPLCFIMIKNI